MKGRGTHEDGALKKGTHNDGTLKKGGACTTIGDGAMKGKGAHDKGDGTLKKVGAHTAIGNGALKR
jgi:hypothetical protein